uniref:GEVED domain-containing protein n=1 Tax=Flavobacterium sp. TaxID=239 RepID=UPI00404A41C3
MNETYVSSCNTEGFYETRERTKTPFWRFFSGLMVQKQLVAVFCMLFLVNFNVFATECPDAISIDHNNMPTGQSLVCGTTNDLSSATIVATGVTCSTNYYGGLESLYKFTPLTSGDFNIAYSGQTWTGIMVFQGCPTIAESAIIACTTSSTSSKNVTASLVAGTEYYIMFDTWPTPASPCTGTFTMTGPPPPSDFPPTCATTYNPANLALDVVRNPTLSVSGLTNGPTSFDLYLGTSTNPEFFGTYTSSSIVPGALLANTTYYWKVIPINNIGSASGCAVQSFTTGTGFNYCTAVPTSMDAQGATNFVVGSFSNPNVFSGAANAYQNFTALEGLTMGLGTTNEASVTISYAFGYRVRVFIDFNQDGEFDLLTENFNLGLSGSPAPFVVTGNISIPLDALMGETRLRIVATDNDAINDPCYSGSWANVEDYTVTITEAPSCLGANTLTTSNISSSAAGLFWVDPNETPAASYTILYGEAGTFTVNDGNGTEITNASNPYGLPDLNPNTVYTFYIKTICGEGDEGAWSSGANFQTLCESFDLPFTENFDSTTAGSTTVTSAPDCWSFADTGVGYVYTATLGNQFSEPNHFRLYNGSDITGDYMLISPQVNALGGSLVSFYAYGSSLTTTVQVGTMSIPTDPSTFTLVETIALNQSTTAHALFTVTLPEGTDGFLAFRHGLAATAQSVYIDDITVQVPPVDPPTCANVFSPLDTTSDVALNPTLSWSGSTGFPDTYNIYFGTSEDPEFVSSVSSDVTSFTPGLLMANTTYYWKIVPESENGLSVGCPVQSFTTGTEFEYCPIVYTNGCNTDAITNVVVGSYSNPTGCSSGSYSAYSDTGIQFEQNLTATVAVSFGTDGSQFSALWIDYNQDGVFSDTEGVLGAGNAGSNGTETFNILIPIDALTGATKMRIRGGNDSALLLTQACGVTSSTYGEAEDYTIEILPAPTCPTPTDISLGNIDSSSAEVSWVSSLEVDSYQIEYGDVDFALGTGNLEEEISDSPFTISDLNPDSTYEFYIRSVCEGGDFGNWVGPISFTTQVTCPSPTAVSATAAFYTTAEVSWTNGGDETAWIIEYGTDDFEPGTGIQVPADSNPFTLTDLVANTNYEIYVYAVCSEEDLSLESSMALVFTGACIPVYDFGKTSGDLISNVSIAGTTLSNNSGTLAVNPAYTFFTADEDNPNLTAELAQGSTYTVTVSIGTWGNQHVRAWIDFNEDGVFSDDESIGSAVIAQGQGSNSLGYDPATFEVALTNDSSLGSKTMRIRSAWDSNSSSTLFQTLDPCTSYGFGETEDYTITIVPAPPGTTIAAEDCDTTLGSAFYEYFNIIPVENAQAYRVKISDGLAEQVFEVVEGTQVRFQDFGTFNFTYGETYAVSVSTKLNEAYGPYGAACDITLTADPLTEMQSFCDTTIPGINSKIYFLHVPQATNYRYSVTNTATNEEFFVEVPRRFMYFSDMEEYEFGTTYSIKCQVEIDGSYGSFGAACDLTTIAGVTSQLRTEFCDITLPSKFSNIYADNVVGAVGYRFRVTNGADQTVVERTDSKFNFTMIPAESLFDDTEYTIEVALQFNGVWGEYGDPCTVSTPVYVAPTTQLRTQFCNTTVTSMGQNVYANIVRFATQYRFKLVHVASGYEEEVVRPNSRFALAFAPGISPSTTYDVTVAAYLDGEWLPYGPVCTLTSPALPAVQLRPQYCGVNLPSLTSNFYSQVYAGAVEYRFKTTVNGEEVEVYRPDSRCFLVAFGDVQTDVVYSVQSSYRFGETWSPYGAACTLTVFSPVPVITLDEASCGGAFDIFTGIISADIVENATGYRFVSVDDAGVSYFYESESEFVDFYSLQTPEGGFMDDSGENTYSITVAAQVNGVWGEYGAACLVTFGYFDEGVRLANIADVTSTVAYPNPFENGFSLQIITKSSSAIFVNVYDMTGKLVEKQTINDLGVTNNFGANLAAGVYNVHVSQDEITHVVRVVKK